MGGDVAEFDPIVVSAHGMSAGGRPGSAGAVHQFINLGVAIVEIDAVTETAMVAGRKVEETTTTANIDQEHGVVDAGLIFIQHEPCPRWLSNMDFFGIDRPFWIHRTVWTGHDPIRVRAETPPIYIRVHRDAP